MRSSFGTYRGLIRLALAWLENLSGRYRQFKQIRWGRVTRVVFVCHGNICRSPYAEARAVSFGLSAASFGLSAGSGEPADPTACRIAARRGIELARHCARDAADFELQTDDLLVVMEPRQARRISGLLQSGSCQLTLLAERIAQVFRITPFKDAWKRQLFRRGLHHWAVSGLPCRGDWNPDLSGGGVGS